MAMNSKSSDNLSFHSFIYSKGGTFLRNPVYFAYLLTSAKFNINYVFHIYDIIALINECKIKKKTVALFVSS